MDRLRSGGRAAKLGAAVPFVIVATVSGPGLFRSVTADECGALPAERAELLAARQEHLAMVSVARNCPGEATIAAAVAAQPFVSLDSCKMFSDSVNPDIARAALPGYLDATLYLSKAIAAARAKMAGKAVIDHLISGLFEWTIVVTGLFTTILISASRRSPIRAAALISRWRSWRSCCPRSARRWRR